MGNPIEAMEKLVDAIQACAGAAETAANARAGSGEGVLFSPEEVEAYASAARQLAEAYEKLKG